MTTLDHSLSWTSARRRGRRRYMVCVHGGAQVGTYSDIGAALRAALAHSREEPRAVNVYPLLHLDAAGRPVWGVRCRVVRGGSVLSLS